MAFGQEFIVFCEVCNSMVRMCATDETHLHELLTQEGWKITKQSPTRNYSHFCNQHTRIAAS